MSKKPAAPTSAPAATDELNPSLDAMLSTLSMARKKSMNNCMRYASRSGGTPNTCQVVQGMHQDTAKYKSSCLLCLYTQDHRASMP